MHRLFVYGNLKKGYRSEHHLKDEAFVGFGKVEGELYYLGKGSSGLKLWDGSYVYGEVYNIDDVNLARLDRFEGYSFRNPSKSLYIRHEVDILLEDGTTVSAFAYEYNGDVSTCRLITDGVHRNAD